MAIRDFRYHFRWGVVVPAIFGGIAFLSALLSFLVARHYHRIGLDDSLQMPLWALLFALSGVVSGLLVTRRLLMPLKRLMQRVIDIPVLAIPADEKYGRRQGHELKQFETVLERVAEVLIKLDARQLFPEIIGDSRVMRDLLRRVQMLAPTDATMLLMGESGTGKKLVAACIHSNSPRRQKPFITVDCAGVAPDRLEYELFGYEKDALTGTGAGKSGRFELVEGGTLFLDEIGALPLALQAKILRVLQEKAFDRAGGTRPHQVDVRIICATNQDLARMVDRNTFREDLYNRISGFALSLPALRDRREDIPQLVEDFLARASSEVRIAAPALQLMIGYSWPGNVRELQDTVEQAAALSRGREITVDHLPHDITRLRPRLSVAPQHDPALTLDDKLRRVEKGMIIEALQKSDGVQVRAAAELGINQRSLWHRIKKYQIDVTAFRGSQE